MFLMSAELTLAPAVRLRSWDVTYRWQHWIGWIVWYASILLFYTYLNKWLPDHDPYILPVSALLSGWGILTIWRLNETFGLRQTIWLAVSVGICLILLRKKNLLLLLKRYKYLWLVCGLLLTALTFTIGIYPSGEGPRLWLAWGGLFLQPSEPLKLLLIVYLASYLAGQLPNSNNLLRSIIPTIILMAVALIILIAQRDLGTASIFIFIYFTIVYFSTGKRRVLILAAVLTLGAASFGTLFINVIHTRLDSWLNPWLDPSGKSYQVIQSIIAVAAGGFFGRGIGLGSPGLIPVAQSDYIFTAIVEETGLVGGLAVLALFCLLAGRGMQIALHASTLYKRFLSAGITAYFIIQTCIITGGNIRLFPLTGITLPLVSYGGSSLLTSMLACLLLILVSSDSEEEDPALLPTPRPYLLMGSAMLIGLFLVGLVVGYWAIFRADDLLSRTDNPRRGIDDYYVLRGSILDRNGAPLAMTTGKPGEFSRQMLYPPLGSVVGYNNPTYGQAGLEASLDDYLRGLLGNSEFDVWINHILYGQPPAGSDILLTLDLEIQKKADALLGDHHGAIVLMNAKSGEILAMASHPTFDPNILDKNWDQWVKDPNYPLVNRSAQINYSISTILGPFLYANGLEKNNLPQLPSNLNILFQNQNGSRSWECTTDQTVNLWPQSISTGCPGAVEALYQTMNVPLLKSLLDKSGLEQSPFVPLMEVPSENDFNDMASLNDLRLNPVTGTPLQMARLASAISSQGYLPTPLLTISAAQKGKQVLLFSSSHSSAVFSPETALKVEDAMAVNNLPIWQTTARVYQNESFYTWFIGGTTSTWQGAPLAVAVLVEEDDPALTRSMGISLLESVVKPAGQ